MVNYERAEGQTFWRKLEKAGAGLGGFACLLIPIAGDSAGFHLSINPALHITAQALFVLCTLLAGASYTAMLVEFYDKQSDRFSSARRYYGVRLILTCSLVLMMILAFSLLPMTVFSWLRQPLFIAINVLLLAIAGIGIALGVVVAGLEAIIRRVVSRLERRYHPIKERADGA